MATIPKPLNLNELAQIAIQLQALVGAQLQECIQSTHEAGLGFYHQGKTHWLWFDLNPQRPSIIEFVGTPPHRKKLPRPFTLFIRSHFEGRRLESVRADLTKGRVLVFTFFRAKDEKPGPIEIEAHLIPHAANLIAIDGKVRVAESKPKDLPPPDLTREEPVVRTWDEIKAEWMNLQSRTLEANKSSTQTDAVAREKKYNKAVEKKRAALERMKEELASKTSGTHRELGDWLKTNLSLENLPAEWTTLVDSEKSVAWNIENAFHRAKENVRKSEGTRTRIEQVAKELGDLESAGLAGFDRGAKPGQKQGQQKPTENLLAKADAKGRRHQIGDLDVFIGKSAADNLAILRRAQPFDLWLHLRDYPGSHAIMRRTRGRNVTDAELQDAGRWVIEQSLGLRAKTMKGERFDLLIVECRFVRPIKGDKLGRVNYTNDRVMSLRY